MTRNLYLGTTLQPILTARSPSELLAAAGAGYARVEANRPAERMDAIGEEIATLRPHLVAVQEAAVFHVDVPHGQGAAVETTTFDLLELLLASLAARGAAYEVVATFVGTRAEAPAGIPPTRRVRLTDRTALLARPDVKLSNVRSSRFAASLSVPTPVGEPLTVARGWIAADVTIGGKACRFVATHLEAFADAVQVAQGRELLAGPAATELPIVIAGDLNTRADGLGSPTYGELLAAGFVDTWRGPEGTCCRDPDLARPSSHDKRVDLILARAGFRVVDAAIVDGKTASGLWRSDHAGVYAVLEIAT